MRVHHTRRRRGGAILAEFGLIAPVLTLLIVGLIVAGLGLFRYQQVATVAREAARYAAVRGNQYAQETGKAAAVEQSVYDNAIRPWAIGLDLNQLNYRVQWDTSKWPTSASATSNPPGQPVANKVIVTITYQWIPEVFFGGVTLTSRAEMPMAY
jgi:Flp pilus assembly protein TadG